MSKLLEQCDECGGELRYCRYCDSMHHTDSFGQDHKDTEQNRYYPIGGCGRA